MFRYTTVQTELLACPRKWLVTGAAGFIGSHLVEQLLRLDQIVVGLDNFATGKQRNLAEVRSLVSPEQWGRFRFIEGDICRPEDCQRACAETELILHQAALGSVSRSLTDPLRSHQSNVDGFLNMLIAARDAKAKRFVYASSSSVYGDHPVLPKVENIVGRPLSPYAVTKLINEKYAEVFSQCYGLHTVGLRYFNVFGPRQDAKGSYAAVIPKWFSAIMRGEPVLINGDGETSRDFCYVANVVQANLLAAVTPGSTNDRNQVYNIAAGRRTTLNELFVEIRTRLARLSPTVATIGAEYHPERPGDVRHSLADVHLAQSRLGYVPTHDILTGLDEASAWYLAACTSKE